jgi:hypothetical protein
MIALAPLAAAVLWGALTRIGALLGYPYPHDGLEGTLLSEARLLRAGEPLYQPLELHRFVSAPYPPIHYLALALFDLHIGPHVFWSGRLVSLLAALTIAATLAVMVWRSSRSLPAAAFSAILLLSAPPVILWSTRIKPDLLALAFTTLGLLLTNLALSAHNPEPTTQNSRIKRPNAQMHNAQRATFNAQTLNALLPLAALCFVCAFFTKQTAVAGPLAAGIALLITDLRNWHSVRSLQTYTQAQNSQQLNAQRATRNAQRINAQRSTFLAIRRRTLAFAMLYLALTLGVWALLDLATNRNYTLHVWWNFERGTWWSFTLFSRIVALLAFWWPAMLLAVVAVVLSFRNRAMFVPAIYVLVAPLTLLGAGETGSHHNHLLETHAALALAAGCTLGWGLRSAHRPLAAVTPAALAALQFWLSFTPPAWYEDQLAPKDPPERFLVFMHNTPGEILADDTGLLFQADKPLRYNDPSTMGPAARTGKWNQRGLLADIAAHRFSAIMIPVNAEKSLVDPSGRWTPEMLAAIRQHYRLAFRDRIYTFVPRS